MDNFKKYKIGMRTVKTGIAVSLSMFIASFINLKSPIFVGIGAIMAMQSSVSESFNAGINRMLGTIVGAIVGLLFSFIFPQNFIFLGLGIIIVIHIHYLFNWKKSLTLSAIVFMAIFLNSESARIPYATNRIIDTFIGISVAVLVNYFLFTPKKKTDLLLSLDQLVHLSKSIICNILSGADISLTELKSQIDFFRESNFKIKEDVDLNFYKTTNTQLIKNILSIMDEIYTESRYLIKINNAKINDENLILLEKLSLNISQNNLENTDELNIVYNYHLNNILKKTIEIEEILKRLMTDFNK